MSNMVATRGIWLFNFKYKSFKNKLNLKIQCLLATSQILNSHMLLVVTLLEKEGTEHLHCCRKFYWAVLSPVKGRVLHVFGSVVSLRSSGRVSTFSFYYVYSFIFSFNIFVLLDIYKKTSKSSVVSRILRESPKSPLLICASKMIPPLSVGEPELTKWAHLKEGLDKKMEFNLNLPLKAGLFIFQYVCYYKFLSMYVFLYLKWWLTTQFLVLRQLHLPTNYSFWFG